MGNSNEYQKKRIIFITVDCLRADFLGCLGDYKITPNIDKFANNSTLFSKAFSNGPGTNQSFPSILTSSYFFMHPDGFHLSPNCTTLAEVLRKKGFKTSAFHSNPFLSKTFGWARGFDQFYDFMDNIKSPSAFVTRLREPNLLYKFYNFLATSLGANNSVKVQHYLKQFYYLFSGFEIPYLEGKEINRHVFNWINKNLDESFFIWMHYMDPHYPLIPPEPYLEHFTNRKKAFEFNTFTNSTNPSTQETNIFRDLYKGEVKYIDDCMGELIQFLKVNNMFEDTLIIFTADHGNAFMEHNNFGHTPEYLYNEVIHVPLIIHGLDSSKKINYSVQLLDISPTLLNLLNIDKPSSFFGDNKLLSKDNQIIFTESAKPDLINLKYNMDIKAVSCIFGKWKLIINDFLNTKELYNIENDYDEKINMINEEKEIAIYLENLIHEHMSNTRNVKHNE